MSPLLLTVVSSWLVSVGWEEELESEKLYGWLSGELRACVWRGVGGTMGGWVRWWIFLGVRVFQCLHASLPECRCM